MWRIALGIVVIAACSQPSRSPHGGDGKGPAASPDAGAPSPDAAPPTAPVTEAECHRLIDHILGIVSSKTYDDLPPEERDGARQDAHDALAAQFLTTCLSLDRPGFECMMNAPDRAAVETCGE